MPVSVVKGIKGHLGAKPNTAATDLRSAVVAPDRFARIIDATLRMGRGEELDPSGGRAELEDVYLGQFELGLRATMEGSVEGLTGYLAQAVMGANASAQQGVTTAYLHTLTVADSLAAANRLAFELKLGTLNEAIRFNGVPKLLRWEFGQPGLARLITDIVGSQPTRQATPASSTLPASATKLSRHKHTLTVDTVSVPARSGFWEVRHTPDEDDYDVTSQFRRDAELGAFEAEFELEAVFQNQDHVRRFWGGATVATPSDTSAYYAANVKAESVDDISGAATHKYTIELDLPRVFLRGPSDLDMRGKGALIQRIKGIATFNVGTYAAQMKLKSTQTTVV